MTVGVIIQAAEWIADHPLSEEPNDTELHGKFVLSRSEANEARRTGNEMRERRAFEHSKPRYVPGSGGAYRRNG